MDDLDQFERVWRYPSGLPSIKQQVDPQESLKRRAYKDISYLVNEARKWRERAAMLEDDVRRLTPVRDETSRDTIYRAIETLLPLLRVEEDGGIGPILYWP